MNALDTIARDICGHSDHNYSSDMILSLFDLARQWDETEDAATLAAISAEAKFLASQDAIAISRGLLGRSGPEFDITDEERQTLRAAAEEITVLLESPCPTPAELLSIFGLPQY